MSRPPKKAVESIKNYCLKTQCRTCSFGKREQIGYDDYVGCWLQESNPCDWETEDVEKE